MDFRKEPRIRSKAKVEHHQTPSIHRAQRTSSRNICVDSRNYRRGWRSIIVQPITLLSLLCKGTIELEIIVQKQSYRICVARAPRTKRPLPGRGWCLDVQFLVSYKTSQERDTIMEMAANYLRRAIGWENSTDRSSSNSSLPRLVPC
jgi:hypothetical protein